MSLVWVICGAGGGVGKATVAQKLCTILPNPVYAKCGHSVAKSGKPANYFRDLDELISFIEAEGAFSQHVVVESNALVRKGRGDIIIFLAGKMGRTDLRDDAEQLRGAAHLIVDRDAAVDDWKMMLAQKLDSTAVVDAIAAALVEQQRYLTG